MSKARKTHVGKRLDDRQRYMENTVRRQFDPTLEEEALVDFDSTETVSPERLERTGRIRSTEQPQPSSLGRFVREKWPELVIFGLLVWGAITLFGLNREVGSLGSRIDAGESRDNRFERDLEDVERLLRDEMNWVRDRFAAPSQFPPPPAARPQPSQSASSPK